MNGAGQILLVGECFSPWTKKARWALDACGIPTWYREYTPTLSEPWLRWRLKQWSGAVSVPVLFAQGKTYSDSWSIAGYANSVSTTARLGDLNAVKPWDILSEGALAEGRTRVVRAILDDEVALQENLPRFIPKPRRRRTRFLAYDALRRLDRKYAHLAQSGALRRGLEALRDGLAQSEGDNLLGRFSYADITMASILEVVSPLAGLNQTLGPRTQSFWHHKPLAEEFSDLVLWRDRLAKQHGLSKAAQ